jgi:hypothetical protein
MCSPKSNPQRVALALVKLTGATVDESKAAGPPAPTAGAMRRREGALALLRRDRSFEGEEIHEL